MRSPLPSIITLYLYVNPGHIYKAILHYCLMSKLASSGEMGHHGPDVECWSCKWGCWCMMLLWFVPSAPRGCGRGRCKASIYVGEGLRSKTPCWFNEVVCNVLLAEVFPLKWEAYYLNLYAWAKCSLGGSFGIICSTWSYWLYLNIHSKVLKWLVVNCMACWANGAGLVHVINSYARVSHKCNGVGMALPQTSLLCIQWIRLPSCDWHM